MDNPNEDKDEILLKDIKWTEELSKYRDELEVFLTRCIKEKEETISTLSNVEKLKWMRKALCNAYASQLVVIGHFLKLAPDARESLFQGMALCSMDNAGILSLVLDQMILEEKKREKSEEVERLEKLYEIK